MSEHDLSSDDWTDVEDEYRQIRIALPSNLPFSRPLIVSALMGRDDKDNSVSVSLVQRLLKPYPGIKEAGSQETLEWCLATDSHHLTDQFLVSHNTEYDVVLGARACEHIDELDRHVLVYELCPSFATVEEKEKADIAANEAEVQRRSEEKRKEQLRRLEAKFNIQHTNPNPAQPPPPPPPAASGST